MNDVRTKADAAERDVDWFKLCVHACFTAMEGRAAYVRALYDPDTSDADRDAILDAADAAYVRALDTARVWVAREANPLPRRHPHGKKRR